jgi:hypothetical protein
MRSPSEVVAVGPRWRVMELQGMGGKVRGASEVLLVGWRDCYQCQDMGRAWGCDEFTVGPGKSDTRCSAV